MAGTFDEQVDFGGSNVTDPGDSESSSSEDEDADVPTPLPDAESLVVIPRVPVPDPKARCLLKLVSPGSFEGLASKSLIPRN